MIRTFFIIAVLIFFSKIIFAEPLHQYSSPRILDQVFKLIKEKHIDHDKLNLKSVLFKILGILEEEIPELIIDHVSKNKVRIRKNNLFKIIFIDKLEYLSDLNIKIREILTFINTKEDTGNQFINLEFKIINQILKQLDAHSVFFDSAYLKTIQQNIKGEFGGIGAEIKVFNGFPTIVGFSNKSSASKFGVKINDQILDIDGCSTIGLSINRIVNKLRGKPGTVTSLIIRRNGELYSEALNVVREKVKYTPVIFKLINGKIGYFKIESFYKNISNDIKTILRELKEKSNHKLLGFILDLRNNPGGLLEESILVADLFLNKGTIVATREKFRKEIFTKKATFNFSKPNLPIIVLVNSRSASASEVVSAALRNNNKALLIGSKTFGKGSIQTIHNLLNKSALKLTIAHYLTPGNKSIQSSGIVPDILTLPIDLESKEAFTIFPRNEIRERNLILHSKNSILKAKQNSIYSVNYLLNSNFIENENFNNDFNLYLANHILTNIRGNNKKYLSAKIKQILQKVKQKENKKIRAKLASLGIDWSVPRIVPNTFKTKIKWKIINNSFEKFKDILKIGIEIENIGLDPIFQLYGISISKGVFLKNKDFIFGRINPGERKVSVAEFKINKKSFDFDDMIKVFIKANKNKEVEILNIPVFVPKYSNSLFAYMYRYESWLNEMTLLHFKIKNTGKSILCPEIFVKNEDEINPQILIERGFQKIKSLGPGEIKEIIFIFPNSRKNNKKFTNMKLEINDIISGKSWKEQLYFFNDTRITERIPPIIRWLPETIMSTRNYILNAEVLSNAKLKNICLFVNGKKIFYSSLNNTTNKLQNFRLNQCVKLDSGLNHIKLIILSCDNFKTEESKIIFLNN